MRGLKLVFLILLYSNTSFSSMLCTDLLALHDPVAEFIEYGRLIAFAKEKLLHADRLASSIDIFTYEKQLSSLGLENLHTIGLYMEWSGTNSIAFSGLEGVRDQTLHLPLNLIHGDDVRLFEAMKAEMKLQKILGPDIKIAFNYAYLPEDFSHTELVEVFELEKDHILLLFEGLHINALIIGGEAGIMFRPGSGSVHLTLSVIETPETKTGGQIIIDKLSSTLDYLVGIRPPQPSSYQYGGFKPHLLDLSKNQLYIRKQLIDMNSTPARIYH